MVKLSIPAAPVQFRPSQSQRKVPVESEVVFEFNGAKSIENVRLVLTNHENFICQEVGSEALQPEERRM
jgi:hypothetical protein